MSLKESFSKLIEATGKNIKVQQKTLLHGKLTYFCRSYCVYLLLLVI